MTEPIIIDGCNVAECEFCAEDLNFDKRYYCDEIVHDDCSAIFECKDRPDCYFKQLQMLKQKNEYLEDEKREKIKLLEQVIKSLYPNANDDELFDAAFNCVFIDDIKQLKKDNEELKQALEEIKHHLLFAERATTASNYVKNIKKIAMIVGEVLNEQK